MHSMLAVQPNSPVTKQHGELTIRLDTKTFSTISPECPSCSWSNHRNLELALATNKICSAREMRFPRAETGGGCRFERTVMAGAGRINGAIGVKGIRLDCFSFTRASTASFRGTAELDRGPESAPCHSGETAELDGAPESAPFEGSGEQLLNQAPASDGSL